MASQEELIVRIGADFDELKKGLKGAGEETKKFGDSVEKTSASVFQSFGKMKTGILAVVAGLGAAAIALEKFRSHVSESAREQKLWATRLAISVDTFSQLVVVGRQFGASADDVGDSIKDLNERIADAARGNKTYEDALKMVGLESRKLINLPIEEQFIKVADAIGKMTNAGDQNFATAELMADAGFRLLPAFRAGEEGIRGMMKAAQELGSAFNEEEVKLYHEFDKALINLKDAAFAAAKPIANELTGALTGAANATAQVLKDTVAYAAELRALREELMKTAESGNVMSSEIGEINVGLSMAAGSFDLLAESAKNSTDVVEEALNELRSRTSGGEFIIPTSRVGGLETEGDLNEMILDQFRDSYSRMFEEALDAEMSLTDIKRGGVEDRIKLDKVEMMSRMDAMRGIFANLSTLMNTENRKLFEIGKAAAIADATVNTYMGATKALGSAPPPFNFALAAAVTAAGLANIANIASTTMGGGGGGAGGSASSAPTAGGGAIAAPENVIDATFNLQTEQGFVSTDQIRGVAAGLNEFIEDGGRIRSVSVI